MGETIEKAISNCRDIEEKKREGIRKDLETLINTHSVDTWLSIPDFVLADMVMDFFAHMRVIKDYQEAGK